jgi:branched-chain amino acid transport system substrate-binding protein
LKSLAKFFIILNILILQAVAAQTSVSLADPKEAFKTAMSDYDGGSYMDAHAIFAALADSFPSDGNNSLFHFMAAKSLYEAGDYQKSSQLFDSFVETFPGSSLLADAWLFGGHSLYKLQNYPGAAEDYLRAIDLFPRGTAAQVAHENLMPLLTRGLSLRQLENLISKLPSSSEQEEMQYTLAQREIDSGHYRKAAHILQSYLKQNPNGQNAKEAKALLSQATLQSKNEIVLGFMAPLSGTYREYGRAMLEGSKLALKNIKDDSIKINLVVKDTGGDPITAAKLATAISEEEPVAVVGPLSSESSLGAAVALNDRNIPMITPTASESGLSSVGPYIFQLSPSVEKIGQALAEYAVKELKIYDFAVISPDDPSGQKISSAFIQTVYQLGGDIISTSYYSSGTTDFKQQIMPLREILLNKIDQQMTLGKIDSSHFIDSKTGEMLDREEWPVDLGGLFLPGYADDLKLLIPQVRYHVIHTRLLGSDGWDSDDLIREVKPYVGGAIFATDFHIDSNDPAWTKFAKTFSAEYKHPADKVAALSYDATTLVLNGIKNGITGPEQLRDYLADISDYRGVSCPITFKGTERANSGVAVYSIDGKKLSEEIENGRSNSK